MARNDPKSQVNSQRTYWQSQIEQAKKRFRGFWEAGDQVIDAYRIEKADGNALSAKDKYNILYSSVETIRPNLYAQTPNARVKLRDRDNPTPIARVAAQILEKNLEYVISEEDFDEVMENAVEDFLLPGLGTGWVRYEASFQDVKDDAGNPVQNDDGTNQQELLDEMVKIDYVYWQDWLCGVSRGWKTVPWVARRLWMTKDECTKRFGAEKAALLTYKARTDKRDEDNVSETCEIWEIWDKRTKTAYWYADTFANDLLDVKADPLKLKNFFPCPKPLRAISNTRTFVPRSQYSQYKSQAETLNVLTKRIRLLGEALRVVGIYDGSNPALKDMLAPDAGNKMIAVNSWAMFAQTGGIKGNVEFLPIEQVVAALIQLQQAREVCKNEIYEITGFSDIVRGVSKASETLGAQNLKANWAGARVKKMQKEVQRFARDLIAIAGEIIAEHCEPATIALFSGVQMPTDVSTNPQSQAMVQTFMDATKLIKDESRRVATIDIETDSTIMADEEADRKDRTDFLSAAGAFLQQAVPAMEQTPELGPLLGAMLMFVVRTFPASRPIEEEFEKVQKVLEQKGAQGAPQDKNGEGAKAAAAQGVAQIKAQVDTQRLSQEGQYKQQELMQSAQAEQNRHSEQMALIDIKTRELALKERELAIREAELGIKHDQAQHDQMMDAASAVRDQQAQENDANAQQHSQYMAERQQGAAEDQQAHAQSMAEAGLEQQYDQMDREDARDKANDLTGEAE